MDKKVVIFFSLFALLMIGGSLVLSLWVFPKYFMIDGRFNSPFQNAGLIKPQSTGFATSADHDQKYQIKLNWILMTTQMVGVICIVLLVGMRLKKWLRLNKPVTAQGYIFKITRITGKSAYNVFCKAAEDWPVSKEQIEQDFKRYLSNESVPYYVNDFIRKNKKHIDELDISIFQFIRH